MNGEKAFVQKTSNGKVRLLLHKLGLWIAVGCTLFGLVSLFIPDSAGSLLYLLGFPLLCLMLFMF